jgi:hypothetical protein
MIRPAHRIVDTFKSVSKAEGKARSSLRLPSKARKSDSRRVKECALRGGISEVWFIRNKQRIDY